MSLVTVSISCQIKIHISFCRLILIKDPNNSLQDVVRCHLCEVSVPSLHCDIYDTHLCEDCEWEHISDESQKHKIVPFRLRGSYRKCPNHSTEISERYCEQCDIPICIKCFSSKKHNRHKIVDIMKKIKSEEYALQRDLQEIEHSIYPSYKEIAFKIPFQIANLKENTERSIIAINKYKEYLHREIEYYYMEMKYLILLKLTPIKRLSFSKRTTK